jgi:hypothetical protein
MSKTLDDYVAAINSGIELLASNNDENYIDQCIPITKPFIAYLNPHPLVIYER